MSRPMTSVMRFKPHIHWPTQRPVAHTPSTYKARAHRIPAQRWESTSSSASSTKEPRRPNPYKQFGRPFIKVFLGAMFTYQVIYWSWEKLRLDEIKEHKRAEVLALEQQVDDYRRSKGIETKTNAR